MRIAIVGASGRMGRMLIESILQTPGLRLTAALDQADSPSLGVDAAAFLGQDCGVLIESDLAAIAKADCLIDFTRPAGTLNHLKACVDHKVNMVIGTTGFNPDESALIQAASQQIAIVFAPNMSVGVNVTLKLLEIAAKMLTEQFDAEVFEMHHKRKVDAPSGTALIMGETIAQAWGKELANVAQWARHGHTGERQTGEIGFSVARGGDVIGDHTVFFCGAGERIEISHKASSRSIYAQGSTRAALFLADKKTGLYNMQQVLESSPKAE